MKIIYSLLYSLILFLSLPFLYMVLRKKGYSLDLEERFVLYRSKKNSPIWFHCASVGELNVAQPLIEYFQKENNILITVFSPRGKEYAQKKYPSAAVKAVPFDLSFLVSRFIKIHSPKALIVVEGEQWFNLITESSQHMPVVSVNARISPDSFRWYRKLSFVYKKIFESYSLIIARSEKDSQYIKHFTDRVVVCGDLKFVSSKNRKDVELKIKGRVLLAGSTHVPEEEVLVEVFKELRKKYPDLKLVIAPRHLERLNDVKETVSRYGLKYSLRTQTRQPDSDVYLVDTLGELSGLYRYADAVFIGGTIADIGGHNILEAVLENKKVVIGKNYHKIKETVEELKKEGAVLVAENKTQLKKALEEVLKNPYTEINFENRAENIFNCYINSIQSVLKQER
ncbi:3-deoxy-D-manno-octulosonic acid transferase [Persephonella sp.]